MMGNFLKYIADTIRRPRAELTRRQQQLRYAGELVAHCWRVLVRYRAEGMAAELTYRTIFSLIPLVVLGLVTFRVFGGLDDIEDRVADQMYSFFGVPDIPDEAYAADPEDESFTEGAIRESDFAAEASDGDATLQGEFDGASETKGAVPPDTLLSGSGTQVNGGSNSETDNAQADSRGPPESNEPGELALAIPDGEVRDAEDGSDGPTTEVVVNEGPVAQDASDGSTGDDEESDEDAKRRVQASIRFALRELTDKVSTIDFASIGVFGLILFIYAAIALLDSVESVFNVIYSAPSGRPVHLRVAIHWSIITLGSALLAMSLYMSGQLVDYVSSNTGWSITTYANHIVALMSGWVLLFLLYALMPNTSVSVRAAAIGSFVAAALWEVAKFGFQVYVVKLVPYSALYGSLGLIPLFLFWVYVTWFIILFGLVWTYTLQTAPGAVPTREDDESSEEVMPGDPQWLLLIMLEVAGAFERGETLDRTDLRSRLKLPTRFLQPMLLVLQRAELLRSVDSETTTQFLPARPAESIRVAEILKAGRFEPRGSDTSSWDVLRKFRQSDESKTSQETLAQLLSKS